VCRPSRFSWTLAAKAPQECDGIDAEGATHFTELNYVEFALAAFVFRYEGLWAPKAISQTDLGEACALPRLNELSAQLGFVVDSHRN
jgi:hypothetical protein